MVTKSFTSERLSQQSRIPMFDYLRSLMVLFVVLEHSLLPYSPLFKNTAYIEDFGGDLFFDLFHLQNDAIMMPFLFFLAGIFVFPSLDRRGFASFAREKFNRLVIPFIIGVLVLVPPQTFPKYLITKDGSIGFWDYYVNVFLEHPSSSGFWFLAYLLILTVAAVILRLIFPGLIKGLGRLVSWMVANPISGFVAFLLLSCVLLGIGDLIWGPYWFNVFPSFYLRGNRFMEKILFFALGIGFAQAQLQANVKFLEALGAQWLRFVAVGLLAFIAYAYYVVTYFHDGAYNIEFLRFLHQGQNLLENTDEAFAVLNEYAPIVLGRTSLLAFTMVALSYMYLSIFARFLNKVKPFWQSLAAASFGIYIFHEPIQVQMSYFFYQSDWNEYTKFIIVCATALGASWFLTNLLKKLPGFKQVL